MKNVVLYITTKSTVYRTRDRPKTKCSSYTGQGKNCVCLRKKCVRSLDLLICDLVYSGIETELWSNILSRDIKTLENVVHFYYKLK